MKNLSLTVLLSGAFFISCASSTKDIAAGERGIASLDNNADSGDDGFDSNLETYFGGSAATEVKANDTVAAIIRKFIESQKQVRHAAAGAEDKDSADHKRVFNDLPKPDYATRDVHRKTNGCFKADLNFASDLKEKLNAQLAAYGVTNPNLSTITSDSDLGVFAPGSAYDAIVRFSNGHPGNRSDKQPDARGFAVKILPQGTLGSAGLQELDASKLNLATKLDILSINFPTFFVNDPVKYAALNKVFLNSAIDFKNKLAARTEEFRSIFQAAGLSSLERRLALQVNGSIIYSPLYQEYFSMVPSRLGKEGAIRAVKYSWEPVACSAAASSRFNSEKQKQWAPWTNDHTYAFPPHFPKAVSSPQAPYAKTEFPDDYLRANVANRLREGNFCYNLYLQLFRDPVSTNIEDSTDLWIRNETEKNWWAKQIVPGAVTWKANLHNDETRDAYLEKFSQKQIAPRIFAARLVLNQLSGESSAGPASNNKTCEDLSFNPWNGDIVHHKPLGIVSRMKRKVYNASRRTRHELNGVN